MRLAPALALLALLPAAAAAQVAPAATPAPRFGILGGLNSATLSGSANILDEDGGTKERRNGFAGGVYLTLPLGATGLAFRPELLYAQKGARYAATVQLPPSQGFAGGTITGRGDIRLAYVEAPLLLQYTVPAGGFRPQLYAGVAPAVRTSCTFELSVSALGQSTSESDDCENIPDVLEGDDTRLSIRRFDVGAVVGGALGFDVGGRTLTVGVRYTHGLRTLVEDEDDFKNRALGVYGSIEFPFGRARR